MGLEWLYGKDLQQLQAVAQEAGLKPYAAKQLAGWLYARGATQLDQMTDLSKTAREILNKKYQVGRLQPIEIAVSKDGTQKYLFPTLQNGLIESALIPDHDRLTLCVSCQAGCRMGCRFCATGKGGYKHQLTAGEILNQAESGPGIKNLSNIVYMGMGEPLDNLEEVLRSLDILTAPWGYAWSPSRITVSTIGMLPRLEDLLARSRVNLAISLHNPFPAERLASMPAEKAHPIRATVEALRRHDWTGQRRVSFEYILIQGVNDSPAHIKELCRLLGGLACRINLIRLHCTPGSDLHSPPDAQVTAFRDALTAKGLHTTIRASRGEDIQAACGLLAAGQRGK